MQKPTPLITLPVALGLGLLIVGAYFDNVRGPLLPHIARNMGFDYAGSSFFLVLGHICAFFTTSALMPALNKYSERAVTWVCLAFGLATCLASMLVSSYWSLLLFAGAIGVCTSVLGTMSNVVVITTTPADRAGRNLALLHVMFGIGSFLGTVVTGQVLEAGLPWTVSLFTLLPLIVVLAFMTRALPQESRAGTAERRQPLTLGPEHWLLVVLFACYVAGEVLTSMWMTTFLVEADSMTIGRASWYATLFFLTMAITRISMVVNFVHRYETQILFGSLLLGLGFSLFGISGVRWCLPFVGVIGPFFPLLLARASRLYPQRNRTITIYVIIAMQVTLGCMHLVIGQLTRTIPVKLSYWIAPGFLSLAVLLLVSHYALTENWFKKATT